MNEAAHDHSALTGLYAEVQGWFEPAPLRELLGWGRSVVEEISLAWLAKAGKRWRPFLAVCIYDAIRGGGTPTPEIRFVAVALECIHKGSLVYDAIQDDDDQRYGEPTVHVVHGLPLAMTASLLLIGQGYRMLAESESDADKRVEMLHLATDGHCRLCLGQGGELAWMRDPHPLTPEEVLEIFRFKTAPSFDVVFRLPAVCAGADRALMDPLGAFAEIVGTAYQVADDLDDYHGGGDVDDIRSQRPSIVLAYAYQAATGHERELVARAWCGRVEREELPRVRDVVRSTGAGALARSCLAELRRRAAASVEGLAPRIRDLLGQVSDMVFQKL